MREDYDAGLDNFKMSYMKKLDYENFLSRLQNNKYGVVLKDREVYSQLNKDIILPDFLEKYAEH